MITRIADSNYNITFYHRLVNECKLNHCDPVRRANWSYSALTGDPLSLFSLDFDNALLSLIVRETNRYVERALSGTNKEWSTDTAEIRAYLGFMLLMGMNELPEIRDYWSLHEYLKYMPITDRISRNHFEMIMRYLHFVNNATLPS